MKNQKLYPFSARKHAHDIELAHNRTYNTFTDMELGETPMEPDTYERLLKEYDEIGELLLAILGSTRGDGIAWLTGPQIAAAKEISAWAACYRDGRAQR